MFICSEVLPKLTRLLLRRPSHHGRLRNEHPNIVMAGGRSTLLRKGYSVESGVFVVPNTQQLLVKTIAATTIDRTDEVLGGYLTYVSQNVSILRNADIPPGGWDR